MYRRKTDEKLLQELLSRGYGVDERKKWRDRWRRNLEAKYNIERRRKQRQDEVKLKTPGSIPGSPLSAAQQEEVQHRQRAEDAIRPISPRLRRRVDCYAYRNRFRVTGFYERFLSFLTLFFPGIKDRASWNLTRFLVAGKGYRIDNPAAYCLVDNLDALYFSSRFLLGHYKQVRLSDASRTSSPNIGKIEQHLRNRDPFTFEFLTLFTIQDEDLLGSLDFIRVKLAGGKRVEVEALVRPVAHVYRLGMLTDGLDPKRLDDLFRTISEVNRVYSTGAEGRMQIEVAVSRLQIAFSNLTEFQHQLFPVLLKMLGVFFPEEELGRRENRLLVYDFVGIKEEERLTHRQYEGWRRMMAEGKKTEGAVDELSAAEGEQKEIEDEEVRPSFNEKFGEILTILRRVFPGSKIDRLTDWPYILPYFDLKIFNRDITFPSSIQNVSRFDPMGQIMVLHRVIDNMLTSIDAYAVDEVLKKDGEFKESLSELIAEWQRIYPNLFDLYLKELGDYIRMVGSSERGAFRRTPLRESIEENLNQVRSMAIRHYEVMLVGSVSQVRFFSVRLYKLTEELFDLLAELCEKLDRESIRSKDPASVKFYNDFNSRHIVDFGVNEYKPTLRQLRRFFERRFRKPLPSIRKRAQSAFFEILFGIVDLYYYLLNERESPYRSSEGKVFYAQSQELESWNKTREAIDALGTKEPDQYTDQDEDYTIDAPTGLLSAESWKDDFPEQFDDMRAEGFVAILAVTVDGWESLSNTKAGEQIFRDIAGIVLDEVRMGEDRGIHISAFRPRDDEIFVVLQDNCQVGAELAEGIRTLQEEHLKAVTLEAISPKAQSLEAAPSETQAQGVFPFSGDESQNETVRGTVSLGVAQVEDCPDLAAAIDRVEKAACLARESGNSVVVYQDGKLLAFHDFICLVKEAE
jgi:hypothetical protein